MKTPIADFVKNYAESKTSRFHMPGHKGKYFLGVEEYDITEVFGADELSSADGIIKMSEDNASSLFKTYKSFYTTSGSTTAIYAMLSLVKKDNSKPVIFAARNVHKAFVHACALLDLDVCWLMPQSFNHIAECKISAEYLEEKIKNSDKKPSAVYLTSPDYLGNIQDIKGLSRVCKNFNIPLLVDNAHGAYLAFLEDNLHPIHLGSDACCDSAHKTLPVLTGGAYLHIGHNAPKHFSDIARERLSLFSTTSPSYLILQSLDLCNRYLADNYEVVLSNSIKKINSLKEFVLEKGFFVCKTEPLKLTIDASASGYTGYELAEFLRLNKAEPEFYDNDYLVLMLTPENSDEDFNKLQTIFSKLAPKSEIKKASLKISEPVTKLSIRDAVFSETETINIQKAVGRICATPTVSCPPAIPIAISGEEITEDIIKLFKFYGIEKIKVVKRA